MEQGVTGKKAPACLDLYLFVQLSLQGIELLAHLSHLWHGAADASLEETANVGQTTTYGEYNNRTTKAITRNQRHISPDAASPSVAPRASLAPH
jgi:hypothetical protein